jgi:hypothetical protein
VHTAHTLDLQYHKTSPPLCVIYHKGDDFERTIFALHSSASAGTVLITAAAAASVFTAAETGQQKQPDERIAGDTAHTVVTVTDEKQQNEQPGQIGAAEIVEHCIVPPFMMIRRFPSLQYCMSAYFFWFMKSGAIDETT